MHWENIQTRDLLRVSRKYLQTEKFDQFLHYMLQLLLRDFF